MTFDDAIKALSLDALKNVKDGHVIGLGSGRAATALVKSLSKYIKTKKISDQTKEEKPKSVVQLPEEPEIDNDDDDIEDLKSKIMKTMSKIEQAEVD